MSKILLVVDGKEQVGIAIRHLMDLATRSTDDEVIILNVMPATEAWQKGNEPRKSLERDAKNQELLVKSATGHWLSESGMKYENRSCVGDIVDVVTRTVDRDSCDQIVMAEPPLGSLARMIRRMTGLRPSTSLDLIVQRSSVPVTIVSSHAVKHCRETQQLEAADQAPRL